jgi:UDP-3-O-[3-hydroxymyristoyl] glucosamine N-acyltransferase
MSDSSPKTVQQLADHVGGKVVGDGSTTLHSGATLELAGPGQISFLANARYLTQVKQTHASAVFVPEAMDTAAAQIVVPNPYYAFTQALVLLHGHRQHPQGGVSPETTLHPTARVGHGSTVMERVSLGENARVGEHCVLYPGVVVGRDVEIGDRCVLHPNVVIYENCRLGNRVVVHANSTIGHDGLGFSTQNGVHYKIPHVARAIIQDDVELGASSGIERGSLQDTVVGRGSKIGSQVIIGHGVQVGEGCLIVAQTGVAGSTRIGHHCVFAGQVGVAGHIEIGNNVTIAAKSGVSQNVPDGVRVLGYPAFEMEKAVEAYSLIKRLPELRRTLRALEQRVQELEGRS